MHNELKITIRDIWVPPIKKRYTTNELIMFKARDETSKTMSKLTCCRGKDHWILMFQTCFFLNWFHLNELKWFDNFHLFMCCSTYWNKTLVDFLWSLMNFVSTFSCLLFLNIRTFIGELQYSVTFKNCHHSACCTSSFRENSY